MSSTPFGANATVFWPLGGRICIVVGDVCLSRRKAGRHRVVPLHADITTRCVTLGFDNLAPIFWYKIANIQTEMDRPGYFLGKPYEPNGIIKNDVEYILLLRKPGQYRHPSEEQRERSRIPKEDYHRWYRQIWDDIGGATTRDHPAPYPVEIAERLIRMFSFADDTVLDPFLGTGTTMIAAIEAGRNSVGIEVDPHYVQLARRRILQHDLPVSTKVTITGERGETEMFGAVTLLEIPYAIGPPRKRRALRSEGQRAVAATLPSQTDMSAPPLWQGVDEDSAYSWAASGW